MSAYYSPQPGTLAHRLAVYFAKNPDQVLSRADIALKFDFDPGNIRNSVLAATEHGLITFRSPPGGVSVYCAGPRNAEWWAAVQTGEASASGAATPFKSWLQKKGEPSAEGKAPTPRQPLPSPESLVIESGIEMPPVQAHPKRMRYADVFAAWPWVTALRSRATWASGSSARPRGSANSPGGGAKFALRVMPDKQSSRIFRGA